MFSLSKVVSAMDLSDLQTMEDSNIISSGKKFETIKNVLNPRTGEFEDIKSKRVITVPMGMITIDPRFQERQNINDMTNCVIREQVDFKLDAVKRKEFRADPAIVCSLEGEPVTELFQLGSFGTTCVCKELDVELREVLYLGVLSYDVAWNVSRKLNQNNEISAPINNRDRQNKCNQAYERLIMYGITPTPDIISKMVGVPLGYVKARFDNGTIRHVGSFRIDRLRKIIIESNTKSLKNNGIRTITHNDDLGDFNIFGMYVPTTKTGTIYVTTGDYLKTTSSMLKLVRIAVDREQDLNICVSVLPKPSDNVTGEGFFIRDATQITINQWIKEQEENINALTYWLTKDKEDKINISINVSYEEVAMSTVDKCFVEGDNYGKYKEEYNFDFDFETDM